MPKALNLLILVCIAVFTTGISFAVHHFLEWELKVSLLVGLPLGVVIGFVMGFLMYVVLGMTIGKTKEQDHSPSRNNLIVRK